MYEDIEDNLEENIKNFKNLTAELQWITIFKVKDKDTRKRLIEQIEDEVERAFLIDCSIIDDNDKIDLIKNIKTKRARMMVIANLRDENLKKQYIQCTLDESEKVYIIDAMQHPKNMEWILEKCEEIETPIHRAYLIASIRNYDKMQARVQTVDNLVNELIDIKNCEKGKYEEIGIEPEMTVGIEIEAEGMWAKLLNTYEPEIWDWKVKDDCSLIEGVELASPPFGDTTTGVNEIYQMLTMMNKLGLETNRRCGGHVHIGARYLKTIEEYKELFEIYGNAEKIIYLISNKPGELPRKTVKYYAGPISEKLNNNKYNEAKRKDEFIRIAKKIQENPKAYSLNIMNVGYIDKDTIEFRTSNGTLDGDIWVENIRLYARIMQASKEIARIKQKHKNKEEITEDEKEKIIAKYRLKHTNSDDEKMKSLMELLFNEEERETYWQRYNENKKLAIETDFFKDFEFKKVDCQKMFIKPEDINKQEEKDNER